jgi:cytochrome c-type biogenesis protein CcmH/NrfG
MAPPREHVVEGNALEAWTRTVDEPQLGPKALAFVEKAAALYPKNARILFYLGCLCAQQGRQGRAEAVLSRVLDLDPDHDEAARELAQLRRRGPGYSQQFVRIDSTGAGKKAR